MEKIMEDAKALERVLAEVEAERGRQDAQWGGPQNDDQAEPAFWLDYLDLQLDKAATEGPTEGGTAPPAKIRARLVKIAALAVAGIQSIDRRFPAAKL